MQDSSYTLRDHPESTYVVVCETTPLIPASSYVPGTSYVSMTTGCSEPVADPRRNPSRSWRSTGLGREPPSGSETSHSVATFVGATSPCISPSSMSANGEDKENCKATPSTLRPIALISKVSLTLKNSGSVARDHLASERTFLAYVRTSLAIVTAGVGLVQLFISASSTVNSAPSRTTHKIRTIIRGLGASAVVLGLMVLVIGVKRYFSIQSALTTGMFPAARLSAGMIAMALMILITLTLGMMIAGGAEV